MEAPAQNERLITLDEVGERLGKTGQAVRMMIYRGQIDAVRLGERGLRVKASILEAFIKSLLPA